MPLYCKHQSAFRPVALGVSAVVAGTTISLLVQAFGWSALGYVYIVIGIGLYLLCYWLISELIGPANRYFIRVFGGEELERQQKLIALEIVVALFDRKPLPEIQNEDDLVMVEAASILREVLSDEESHGS